MINWSGFCHVPIFSAQFRPAPRTRTCHGPRWGSNGPRRGGDFSTGEVTELVQDVLGEHGKIWEAGDGIFAHE